jgi:diphthine synthase
LGGISQAGIEELKSCGEAFVETYTAPVDASIIPDLVKLSGKSIERLDRAAVEDGQMILAAAGRGKCCLIVPGDPMVATTHVDLRLRAAELGLRTRIVHAASIGTAAAGLLGLQSYKFGRATTLPFWRKGYEPTSPYDAIEANLKDGLHTLVLLDIDTEGGRAMTSAEGCAQLLALESKVRRGVLRGDSIVCAVARAGHDDALVRAGELDAMAKEDLGRPPHCIVVPGQLHFMEAEALVKLAGAPERLLAK